MVPKLNYAVLTPMVFNPSAPVSPTLEVHFDSPPSSVTLHVDAMGVDLTLTPDGTGKVFSAVLPTGAFAGLTAADVQRKFIGKMKIAAGAETGQHNTFADVLGASVPTVSIRAIAADVQYSEHLVNIWFPTLAENAAATESQLGAICQEFYSHFDDEYDFIYVVFAYDFAANRHHVGSRSDAQGIGISAFDHTAQYGSGGRLLGITVFPIATMFDAGAPTASHELGHQWINFLHFPPLQQGIPHWPISDLASDLMGFSSGADKEGSEFNFDLQPSGSNSFKLVPNNQPKGFSDLSLYLMGFTPASKVNSHFVFDNQTQTIVANGTLAGPVTQVTINDVVSHFGPRSPDAAHSQKRFRVATILVTKTALATIGAMQLYDFFAARAGASTLLAYSDGLEKAIGKPFRLATNGIGRLNSRLKRHILIDSSRDGGVWWSPQSGPFVGSTPHQGKALADHLKSLGHTVSELPRPTAITSALLADYDIIIRVVGGGAYSSAEIAAYDAWVKDGGSLLLLAELNPSDGLATHFGLLFHGKSAGKQLLSQFVAHPLTNGVGTIPYLGGSGITAPPATATIVGRLSNDSFLDLNGNGKQDAGEPSAPGVLGVMPWGDGKIVFSGDANLWEKVPQPLVHNTLRWFAS